MIKMDEKAVTDRPREKLTRKGARALSEFELLQALIGSGNKQADVSKIARDVQKLLKRFGHDIPRTELERVTGLADAKISVLLASFELSRRYLIKPDVPTIETPESVVAQLDDIRDKKQEYCVCLTLDGANHLIEKRVISIGTLMNSLIHPREVFADAITDRAASIIVAHNHPSGNLEPSEADIQVTARLKEAGELLGIELLDHVIVTKESFLSVITTS